MTLVIGGFCLDMCIWDRAVLGCEGLGLGKNATLHCSILKFCETVGVISEFSLFALLSKTVGFSRLRPNKLSFL